MEAALLMQLMLNQCQQLTINIFFLLLQAIELLVQDVVVFAHSAVTYM
jgi:hypothetical protein